MSLRGTRAPVVILCSLQFVDVMASTMVITLLPAMLRDLGVGASAATFIATAYAVAFGGCLVLGARLGDVFGHRRIIVLSSVVFAVASVVLATATSLSVLASARFVQGLAAAATVPAALFLITSTTEEGPQRQRAVAAWSAAGAAAGATGFLVGALASTVGHWRVAFLLVGAVAVGLGFLTWRMFCEGAGNRSRTPLDIMGGAALTAGVGLLVAATAMIDHDPGRALGLGAGAMMASILLVFAERRAAVPVLPAAVLRSRPVQRGSTVSFVNTATTSSAATMVTLSLQQDLGRSGAATAAVLLPFSLAVIVGASLAPELMRFRPGIAMATGLAGIGLGTALLPFVHGELLGVGAAMAVSGVGIGLSSSAATHLGTSVHAGIRAASGAVLNTAAQLGTALGIAASLAVAQRWGYAPAWLALAALACGVALVSVRWTLPSPYSGERDDS